VKRARIWLALPLAPQRQPHSTRRPGGRHAWLAGSSLGGQRGRRPPAGSGHMVKCARIACPVSSAPQRQPQSIRGPAGRPDLTFKLPRRRSTSPEAAGRFGPMVKCVHISPGELGAATPTAFPSRWHAPGSTGGGLRGVWVRAIWRARPSALPASRSPRTPFRPTCPACDYPQQVDSFRMPDKPGGIQSEPRLGPVGISLGAAGSLSFVRVAGNALGAAVCRHSALTGSDLGLLRLVRLRGLLSQMRGVWSTRLIGRTHCQGTQAPPRQNPNRPLQKPSAIPA
jgi:hypothetical protein